MCCTPHVIRAGCSSSNRVPHHAQGLQGALQVALHRVGQVDGVVGNGLWGRGGRGAAAHQVLVIGIESLYKTDGAVLEQREASAETTCTQAAHLPRRSGSAGPAPSKPPAPSADLAVERHAGGVQLDAQRLLVVLIAQLAHLRQCSRWCMHEAVTTVCAAAHVTAGAEQSWCNCQHAPQLHTQAAIASLLPTASSHAPRWRRPAGPWRARSRG